MNTEEFGETEGGTDRFNLRDATTATRILVCRLQLQRMIGARVRLKVKMQIW